MNRDLGTWQHRGFTHSFFGWPLLALVGAAVSSRWLRTGRYRDHLGLWAAGLLSHALLDWPTTWGTQLLWPLSEHRFALEWIFIVDPMFWVLVWALPWGLAWWFGRTGEGRSRAATVGLLALSGWIVGSGVLKELATAAASEPVAAFPAPGAPFRWTGVTPTVPNDPEVRRYWLTLGSAEPAGTFSAARGTALGAVTATHTGERDLWMSVSPVIRDERTNAAGTTTLTVVDLAYTNWLQPDSFRFGHAYTLAADDSVLSRSGDVSE